MKNKQILILAGLGLFLVFDLLLLVAYQQVKQSSNLANQVSEELIANYNVSLDASRIRDLAAKINPHNESFMAQQARQPGISLMEPSDSTISAQLDEQKKATSLYLYNANGIEGDANIRADQLRRAGYNIAQVSNFQQENEELTIIYYEQTAPPVLQHLQYFLKAIYNEVSLQMKADLGNKVEIILGQPAQN